MTEILQLDGVDAPDARRAAEALETGGLVLFPHRPFALSPAEQALLDPAILDPKVKNVSLDPATGKVGGVQVDAARQATLAAMIGRYAETADALIGAIAPGYAPALQRRRTSFRPGQVATRALSPRKDDRRLHVDAFPSNPTHGRRILRVFANVNPHGQVRTWEVGEEDFEATARRFRSRLTARGRTAGLKAALKITRGRQSAYDQLMLQLHDAAKLDDAYQTSAPKQRIEFPAGAMWVVYTDSVLHAALGGQHALEQTYLMPVQAMADEAKAPIRVLERMLGRGLG